MLITPGRERLKDDVNLCSIWFLFGFDSQLKVLHKGIQDCLVPSN